MKKLITLAAIVLIAVTGLISVCQAQPVDPSYYHYKQKKANWLFDIDTVRINNLRIDNKAEIDSFGRIKWYNNTIPSLGEMLLGNGTYYAELAIGSSNEVLTVSGGTADWLPITGATLGGFTEGLPTYGNAGGGLDQDPEWEWRPTTNYMLIGDESDVTGTTPGTYVVSNGIDASSLAADNLHIGNFALGEMTLNGGTISFMDLGGDLFSIGRATWSADMDFLFPAALPLANQELYVVSVAGPIVTTGWRTGLTAEVDGSTTNELQNLSYDAANHQVDIDLGGTSATIPLADDDGATEGLASFDGSDFNADANGNITTDYANGQAGTNAQDGYIQAADFTTFSKANGFTMTIVGVQATINDAQNYYSGATTQGTGTTADVNRVYVPANCVLKSVYGFILNSGTLSSGEDLTAYIRQNNTTDITISSTVETNATHNTFSATGLSTSFSAGDYVEGKFLTPTWVTNPTNCRWTIVLYFEAL